MSWTNSCRFITALKVDWDGYTIGYYGRIFEARNKTKGGSFEVNLVTFAIFLGFNVSFGGFNGSILLGGQEIQSVVVLYRQKNFTNKHTKFILMLNLWLMGECETTSSFSRYHRSYTT